MPKKKQGGGSERLSVSITAEERAFLDNNQLSASKLLKWAIEQKGFKPAEKAKK